MSGYSRLDNSKLARWWWTVDRWTLGCIFILIEGNQSPAGQMLKNCQAMPASAKGCICIHTFRPDIQRFKTFGQHNRLMIPALISVTVVGLIFHSDRIVNRKKTQLFIQMLFCEF